MRMHTDQWAIGLRGGGSNIEKGKESKKDQSEQKHEETGLTRISLAHNSIADKGALALAEALKFDKWITGLDALFLQLHWFILHFRSEFELKFYWK